MTHRAPSIIVPHSSLWAGCFREERDVLLAARPGGLALEHIGSILMRSMPAKPIIDMMLGADSLLRIEALIPELAGLGYEVLPHNELKIPERRFFAKPLVRRRRSHLRGVVTGRPFWHEHVLFKDKLQSDARLADAYAIQIW